MHITVCIKQVPAISEIEINKETNNLVRVGAPSMINPADKNAVEEALTLKQAYGGTVTVITMGRMEATEILRDCISIGADKGYIINDDTIAGSDTLATGYVLAETIKKLGGADVVLCGKQAYDGYTGQVGPAIAERLGFVQLTNVQKLDLTDDIVTVERLNNSGLETIQAKLPVLCTVIENCNTPRNPTVKARMAAKKAEFEVLTTKNLGLDLARSARRNDNE
ncbi:MAG: electron transfer flavoprotein alpha/beta-subunit [Firmicutes bacterium]|nr:electron transfer flavoprotein alpha/beta-subunit [Bacillota bacterium]